MRILIGAILCSTLFASPLSDFDSNLLAFYTPFDLFLRRYQGCPDTGPSTALECKPDRAQFDYQQFNRSRKAAEKLFAPDR